MNASIESSQLKKRPNALLNNLKLRWTLFTRRYANLTGVKRILVRLVMYLLIMGLAFVFIFPFIYMITTSLMSDADLNSTSVAWLPTEIKFENYAIALQIMNITRYIKNSAFVTVVASIGHVLACSFVGYGFARFNFPLKKPLFALVILAFIVPTQTIITPLYLTYSNMQWLDTYLPLTVPASLGWAPFLLTVPKSLEEAARIDGCGFLMTFWRIVFPLAKATVVVALVLSVVWHWNDAYETGIYISKPSMAFLPPRLKAIVSAANALPEDQQAMMRQLGLDDGEDILNDAVVMAGAVIISAPVLLFFAFAQRQFMQGIERSGITGE